MKIKQQATKWLPAVSCIKINEAPIKSASKSIMLLR